jgi:hypothetical protein
MQRNPAVQRSWQSALSHCSVLPLSARAPTLAVLCRSRQLLVAAAAPAAAATVCCCAYLGVSELDQLLLEGNCGEVTLSCHSLSQVLCCTPAPQQHQQCKKLANCSHPGPHWAQSCSCNAGKACINKLTQQTRNTADAAVAAAATGAAVLLLECQRYRLMTATI